MCHRSISRFWLLILLIAALATSGCSVGAGNLTPPAPGWRSQPTPLHGEGEPEPAAVTLPAAETLPAAQNQPAAVTQAETAKPGGTGERAAPADLDAFKAALLQALMAQDTATLQRWMSAEFLTGWWGADGSFTDPASGLRMIYADYLSAGRQLELVQGADLPALIGDRDPLSFPRSDAGVIEAALVSGWGKDGRSEAILFIAREADNSLKWNGWIYFQGGISGARLGGIQLYSSPAYGYRVYLPKGYEIQAIGAEGGADSMLIMAPGVGHPGEQRAAAFIEIKPAYGRSVEAITEQVKADAGPGFNIPTPTAMGLDKAMAIVLSGLPGQDVNRQLFVVYNDLLYHITFVPDTPNAGASYQQMEDLYAMIVNTFHFTN